MHLYIDHVLLLFLIMARHSEPTTAPLLHTTTTTTTTRLNKFLALLTFLSLSAAVVFAVLYFSNGFNSACNADNKAAARQLSTLRRPTVVLISSDGFRFGYEHKTALPNIRRLISNGTSADAGLISSFPTLTFPNHYSIATGLYPSHHGIVNHKFLDPATGDRFNMSSLDPRWWLGEPLWETLANHNLTAAIHSWPGSEVKKGSWDCPPKYCPPYNLSVPFEDRVDAALAYFDTDDDNVPSLVTVYFDQPDHLGHQFGPDDEVITESVARVDDMIGRLMAGLEERRVFEDVNIILLGDHGMVGTCDSKLIFLEDLSPWIDLPRSWVEYYSTLLSVRPPPGVSPAEVVEKMKLGLGSGRVENGMKLKVFLKEDLPERLHYSDSDRIAPIIGMPDEGYLVLLERSNRSQCGGAHGYDNAYFSMRSIFVGHGPRFRKGWQVPSFENVEVYNVVTAILGIDGAPNDGSPSFPDSILLPTK